MLDALLANSPLPIGFGALYRQRHYRATYPQMLANARAIFSLSEALARAQGAGLLVVFLPTPEELGRGAFDIDVAPLGVPSLLPDCPPADQAAALRFPHNGHYDPRGHAWAAAAVERILVAAPAWRAAPSP